MINQEAIENQIFNAKKALVICLSNKCCLSPIAISNRVNELVKLYKQKFG
jgi:hypothetical protein